MVDEEQVWALYEEYFDIGRQQIESGAVTVSEDGAVSVKTSVFLMKRTSKIPIKLNKVSGNFYADDNELTTLENFPSWVMSDLDLRENQLTNLKGGPKHVGGNLFITRNPLVSLEGFPEVVEGQVRLTWHENLPLLRTLVSSNIVVYGKPRVGVILNKYAGQGKAGAFDCRQELKKAGFEGNARW